MTKLTTLETSSWVIAVLRGSTTASRQLYTYLVAHEITFVVLGYAFFSGLAIIKFLRKCV